MIRLMAAVGAAFVLAIAILLTAAAAHVVRFNAADAVVLAVVAIWLTSPCSRPPAQPKGRP
ncbi:hypothetical protein NKG94_34590 [Micromonospora sp. M12]